MSQERTAEDWARVAVALPGWRWMPGMLGVVPLHREAIPDRRVTSDPPLIAVDRLPDPDDAATAGCLLDLLGEAVEDARRGWGVWIIGWCDHHATDPSRKWGSVKRRTLGRACIAAAEALGRWPGGEG